jgi:glutamine synthetase
LALKRIVTAASTAATAGETLNRLDALRTFERCAVIQAAFGAATVASYLNLKHADWNSCCRRLSECERQTTLDS